MKKLKIISPFSIILFITIIYVLLMINHEPISLYSGEESDITGKVYWCKRGDDKTVLRIFGKENVLVNYYGDFECVLGSFIRVYGDMTIPKANTNFYLFNYKNYLRSLKINYILRADRIEVVNDDVSLFYKLKSHLYSYVNSYESNAYLRALILGGDDEIDEDVIESYRINGISHLLAISGAQITMLASFLFYLFKKFFSKNLSYVLVCTFLIFYLFITNFEASILRATIFFIALTVNKQFGLKIKTVDLLITVFSLLLIFNPYLVYSLGFILSFVVSFYLIMFKKVILRCGSYIYKTFIISLIAFLASAPILINNFFSLNLLAPFINVYFVILMGFIYPLAILTFLFKPLDSVFLWVVTLMENGSLIVSKFDFLNLVLSHINIFFFVLYYVFITFILYRFEKGKNYFVLFFIFLLIHHNINYLNPYSSLTMLDVGQGDCFLIKLKHGKGNILIDTGGNFYNSFNMAVNTIIPYLKAEGISQLDYLIITHGDYDHMGESFNLIDDFKVKKVIFNSLYNDLEMRLINKLNFKKIPFYQNVKEIDLGYKLYFLNDKMYKDENDDSLILYTFIDGYKLLFMADAGYEVEADLIYKYNLENIDVLKVGHHGSKSSSSLEFINKVNPTYALISVGENSYGHPHREVLENLKNSKIYRTDLDGAVKFIFKKRLKINNLKF